MKISKRNNYSVTMTSNSFQSNPKVEFKENLRFFQSQIDKGDPTNTFNNCCEIEGLSDAEKKLRATNDVPSVDNILTNVKYLCISRNTSKLSSDQDTIQKEDHNFVKKYNNSWCQSSAKLTSDHSSVSSSTRNVSSNKESSLLSNFNPSFEAADEGHLKDNFSSSLKLPCQTKDFFDSKSAIDNNLKITQLSGMFENLKSNSSLIANVDSKFGQSSKKSPTHPVVNGNKENGNEIIQKRSKNAPKPSKFSVDIEEIRTDDDKEPEYGSEDFVVHKANFPEYYVEEMLFNDDSCDAGSDEEEHIQLQVQFPDHRSSYTNDPQRLAYYTDELEVIPEEDSEYDSFDESSFRPDLHWDSYKDDYVKELNDESTNKTFNDSIQNSKSPKNNKLVYENNVYPEEFNDKLQLRCSTSSWDPRALLDTLYRLDFPKKPPTRKACYLNKEGYIEMLPHGRKKATYWNPWKKKYIRLKNGFLFCFDTIHSEEPSLTVQLMGGQIEILENKMIGIDDQKGHFIVLRCINEDDVESWLEAFNSQCTEDFMNTYTSPSLHPISINKKVIIIDLGSSSIRAGILMSSPSLPQLFFPTVCAINKKSQRKIFGCGALNPDIRKDSHVTFLLHPSAKVAKYSIDTSLLPDLLKYIFQELNIYPQDYKIQLSMPRSLNFQTKLKIARILLDDFQVEGLNLTHQAILSLHAYNSKSGIVVDIGDRLDVIPIIEGYIVESGVTRLPYGGQRMLHHLKHALTEMNISLISDVESYLARYALENLCYVAEDYTEELQKYYSQREDFCMSVSTAQFFQEQCPFQEMFLDIGRFHVPEGLFTPEIWGLDNFGLHKLVYHAIQECGVDLRKEMTKNIYISGGLTLLPGFVERLEREIDKITPKAITPKVHASPYRYHMSYIGACQIALEQKFENLCLTKKIWKKEGNSCVKTWHT